MRRLEQKLFALRAARLNRQIDALLDEVRRPYEPYVPSEHLVPRYDRERDAPEEAPPQPDSDLLAPWLFVTALLLAFVIGRMGADPAEAAPPQSQQQDAAQTGDDHAP